MAITYEPVNPTLIENTTMQKKLLDGVHRVYTIKANEGYVLHDKSMDWYLDDPETGVPVLYLGYAVGEKTCAANYDFTANPREFYAVPADSVPADQIFGGGNDHEVICKEAAAMAAVEPEIM